VDDALLTQSPLKPFLLQSLIWVLFEAGELTHALTYAQILVDLKPDFWPFLLIRADVYMEQGKDSLALLDYETVWQVVGEANQYPVMAYYASTNLAIIHKSKGLDSGVVNLWNERSLLTHRMNNQIKVPESLRKKRRNAGL
jgi:predicted Zn-dependent protease